MSIASSPQATLFGTAPLLIPAADPKRSGTFLDNMKLPVHRWFRYSAGFSADWVSTEITRQNSGRHIFDPFAGSGTTLIAAESAGATALGQEAHPFVFRVCEAKLCWRSNIREFTDLAAHILSMAQSDDTAARPHTLLSKCYDEDALRQIQALRAAVLATTNNGANWKLCWLAFVGILRSTSHAGTAQWQYLLPNKTKTRVKSPFQAYRLMTMLMASDMACMQTQQLRHAAEVVLEDCRDRASIPTDWADLIITSPPYVNNYDYADATRLEMTVLGEIESWGELQQAVRTNLVRSCTQHIAPYAKMSSSLMNEPELAVLHPEMASIIHKLSTEKQFHGGKKNYDSMIVHYFYDMAKVWQQLRRVARDGAKVCFVVGDSAPYGIHVPVERWHGMLAVAAGFRSHRFEKLRDRNTKWKNRKHQVPLHEGRLWVNG